MVEERRKKKEEKIKNIKEGSVHLSIWLYLLS